MHKKLFGLCIHIAAKSGCFVDFSFSYKASLKTEKNYDNNVKQFFGVFSTSQKMLLDDNVRL